MLCKLGYQFNPDDLDQWQIDAYRIIENTLQEQRDKEMKSIRGKNGG